PSSSTKEDKHQKQKAKGQGEDVQQQWQQSNKLQKTMIIYFIPLAILAASVAISSLVLVLPASVVDDYFIHRSYEIPPLALFESHYFIFTKISFIRELIPSIKGY
ncbi:MAG: hypothetical protein ACJ719_02605, partial [Nitrososphaeraceae archaeon]